MRRIGLFLVSMVIWYLLAWPYNFQTQSMDWQIFFAGIVFSILATILFVEVFTKYPHKLFAPLRYFWALCYLPVLFFYMLIANLDVVYRVIHPKMPIDPGLLLFRTRMKKGMSQVTLANSITLTPGTITAMLEDGNYTVHTLERQLAGSLEDGTMQGKISRILINVCQFRVRATESEQFFDFIKSIFTGFRSLRTLIIIGINIGKTIITGG